jgi:hypothetical protein
MKGTQKEKIFMARDASLVPISTAWFATEADICVWFVRLCESRVTGSQIGGGGEFFVAFI